MSSFSFSIFSTVKFKPSIFFSFLLLCCPLILFIFLPFYPLRISSFLFMVGYSHSFLVIPLLFCPLYSPFLLFSFSFSITTTTTNTTTTTTTTTTITPASLSRVLFLILRHLILCYFILPHCPDQQNTKYCVATGFAVRGRSDSLKSRRYRYDRFPMSV